MLCLIARDKDYGNNAKIKYDIVSGNKDLFYIDDVTGTLSIESLNFEDSREHKLTVRATDHGNPPRFSHSNVEVLVKNINDPPKFESNEVTGMLSIKSLYKSIKSKISYPVNSKLAEVYCSHSCCFEKLLLQT